jgi:ATP-dependent exoDNAse (exonuclease V), alpha subunit - helicase superfamily I member
MTLVDAGNTALVRALSFVNHTNRNVFLTGKAGTGKTTFLKYVREHCYKKLAVTAPTGVAAMNAGGTTLHSLFWLPFGLYIADYELAWNDDDSHIYNRQRLFGKVKLTRQRRALLQEIELLIIDEVSMLRADTLDAIDTILRAVRRDARPFGGLQVLFIGDLYQLPPVVKDSEWQVMSKYYPSPFFFEANVLREHPPVPLELTKIYRQSEQDFIDILNSIRGNCCTQEQLDLLNSYYKPDFIPSKGQSYITLTTHNHRADMINREELAALSGDAVVLKAKVNDDFPENLYPVDAELTLKEGAQVMFVRNDSGEERRYYNGKIGYVSHIDSSGDALTVTFTDGTDPVEVKREIWENIRYHYDKAEDRVNEEVLGTFTQFPLRLAWAITIHKSQGLTFDRAMIDAGSSFAAGQVYVALSRLRSLDGLVLQSKIAMHNIRTDQQIARLADNALSDEQLSELLDASQRHYVAHLLLQAFAWEQIVDAVDTLRTDLPARNIGDQEEAVAFIETLYRAIAGLREVAGKFRNQLQGMFSQKETTDYGALHGRITKAVDWFLPRIDSGLIKAVDHHISLWAVKKRTKRYVEELKSLFIDFKRKREQLSQCLAVTEALAKGAAMNDVLSMADRLNHIAISAQEMPSGATRYKSVKGATKLISFELFRSGASVAEIATKRGINQATVTGHLIDFIGKGVSATELMDSTKLSVVRKLIQEHPEKPLADIKALAGQDITYIDIRIAKASLQYE